MRGRVFRNYYEGHMDKTGGKDGIKGGRWVWPESGGVVGENADNNNIIITKRLKKNFKVTII